MSVIETREFLSKTNVGWQSASWRLSLVMVMVMMMLGLGAGNVRLT